jgi:hypothetical protein
MFIFSIHSIKPFSNDWAESKGVRPFYYNAIKEEILKQEVGSLGLREPAGKAHYFSGGMGGGKHYIVAMNI